MTYKTNLLQALAVSILVLAGLQPNVFAATVVVGPSTCHPGPTHFSTIKAAVGSVSAGSTVLVCPGTYHEQVDITEALTLKGIQNGTSDQVVVFPPSGGLSANATSDQGMPVAAQIVVSQAPGTVNISNITVDATGNGLPANCPSTIGPVGIFFQNSPGTVSNMTARNQNGTSCGHGIWIEGGTANPTVKVLNNSVHDVDTTDIFAESNASSPQLSVTITGNVVNGSGAAMGISLVGGVNATVTNNSVYDTRITAVQIFSKSAGDMTGSVSGNTLIGLAGCGADCDGIDASAPAAGALAVTINSNKILNISDFGIFLQASASSVQSNTIAQVGPGGAAIRFATGCTYTGTVSSNSINDAPVGLEFAPNSLSSTNSYFNVGTTRSSAGC